MNTFIFCAETLLKKRLIPMQRWKSRCYTRFPHATETCGPKSRAKNASSYVPTTLPPVYLSSLIISATAKSAHQTILATRTCFTRLHAEIHNSKTL